MAAINRSFRHGAGHGFRGKKSVFHSEKCHSWIYTDSTYEYARCVQLERDISVIRFERCQDIIEYEDSGQKHKYNPDFRVIYSDGSVFAEEVKPSVLINDRIVKAKTAAAIQFYSNTSICYRLITEAVIGMQCILSASRDPLVQSQELSEFRKARRREVNRESAKRRRAASPSSTEQRSKHAARENARYRAWLKVATEEEKRARRESARLAQQKYRKKFSN